MTKTAHPVSQAIRSLYEAYPYPPPEEGMLIDPYLDYMTSFSGNAPKGRPSFLDVGCRSGMMTLGGASLYPHFDTYGCDFCPAALERVRQEADSCGVKNLVELREVELLDFPDDFGPEGGFDVIHLTDVIHHTPDPLAVIKSVAKRLAPGGVMRLMVYSELGRQSIYRFARVAKKLFSHEGVSWEAQISEAQLLMFELYHAGIRQAMFPPPLRGPLEGSHELDDAEFADRYLNPHDEPFTLNSLRELIDQAGLRFHSWFDRRSWDLAYLLPNMVGNGYAPEDPWECYSIVEELFDREQYDLYLVGKDFAPPSKPLSAKTLLGTNPQVDLTDKYFRGFPIESKAKVLFHNAEHLTVEEAKLLRTVGRDWLSLEQMLEQWGGGDTEVWLPIVASLVERDLLYRPHPKP